MKHIALCVPGILNDEIFDSQSQHNRDNCQQPMLTLKAEFQENNIEFHTIDYYLKNSIKPDAVIYSDTLDIESAFNNANNYLLLCECEVIKPKNWDVVQHKRFKRIFTWHNPLLKNNRYIWLNCFVGSLKKLYWHESHNKKLAVLINANKYEHHPLELYSARKNIIQWFEKNHPDNFDLYGFGWDKCRFKTWPWRIFNRTPYLRFWLAKNYRCYRGAVESKYSVLNQYKFCICFENAKNIEGYITEKIFDAFAAGCVPVYWGAPNITDYIPPECFIDYRKFQSNEALYEFLNTMPDERYQRYLNAIKKFIASDAAEKFTPEYFAKKIIGVIMEDGANL